MKSRKTCHPDRFMYPINDESILEMYFTNQKKIKILNVEVHSTDASTYLIQLEHNNFVTFNEKKGKPTINKMIEFPKLIKQPITENPT